MSKNIFIWVAHPKATTMNAGTLCEGLADTYHETVEARSANVRRINLGDMTFTSELSGYVNTEALEDDLVHWQEAIAWADHVMIIHPYWWGAMPSKAKAVLDRALTPGFAYKYHQKGMGWDKLLKGKTADVVITADTPLLIDTIIYRKPARRVLKNQVLGFCGIKVKNILHFGSVKMATSQNIDRWFRQVKHIAVKASA